ncbi:hypothetical protein CM15mP37_10290 [bacterium]|nr:MAG: hypothetical protein CM15mP37_10290 [bacterium]
MLLKFFLSLLLILNLLHAIQSKDDQGDNKKPTIFTKKISKDIIKLDGYLDENEWNLVLPANNFIQRTLWRVHQALKNRGLYFIR